ncbi:MAG: T9SS type B sorting domain-containing protein [Bacteroidota bacterium]
MFCKTAGRPYGFVIAALFTGLLMCTGFSARSQECPPNIDFETGGFDGWVCYTGLVASVNDQNIISNYPSGPVYNRHTMYTANSGDGVDPYGGFPVNCPNGSNHSIRLGNDLGGGQAEGISYQFTVPANRDVYSLIYHYAVVFQDPNHQESQQPRMEVEITNVTDNKKIDCSSFTFHPYGSVLPGFQLSPNPGTSTPVWYKDWSAVTINLNNMAGKTIQLFFKTADCTFMKHFGYAYIDVNSECSGEFTGAAYCPDDTAVHVIAPYGYENYTWFNSTVTDIIGVGQILTVSPPPPVGTRIAVKLTPYNGYGCEDTLYAKLVDTLTVNAHAGPDMFSCNRAPVQIGIQPKPGLVYRWRPARGLSDPSISNPLARPDTTTVYILTAASSGGGCATMDTVLVKADVVEDALRLIGSAAYCVTSGDSAILVVEPTDNIQWFKNNFPIINASEAVYQVSQTGTYYAVLNNNDGCGVTTLKKSIVIDEPRPGISYPVKFAITDVSLRLQARQFGVTALWTPGISLNDPGSFSPLFTGAADKLYTVDIKTSSGCLTTDTQFVKIVSHIDIYVPTGFTPNKDGNNDLLRPLLRGIKQLHYFKVFNRWGQLLFETQKEYEGWNGFIKGAAQQTQTVVWVVEGVGEDNKLYKKTGTTVLLR